MRTIYLDNAATSHPKAPPVEQAILDQLRQIANPGRSGHRLAVAAERVIEHARLRLAELLSVDDARRVVFAASGTDALHLAIEGCLRQVELKCVKPRVIATMLDHNAVRRPLEEANRRGRIELQRIASDASALLDVEHLRRILEAAAEKNEPPHLVTLIHASNVTGLVQPIDALTQTVRELAPAALIVLDAAQTVGVREVSFDALNVDLMAFSGHKGLLAPTGVGALIVGPRVLQDPGCIDDETSGIAPVRAGGTGGDSASPVMPRRLPSYLEAGTPNTLGLAGLAASLDWLMAHTVERIEAHERELIRQLLEGLEGLPGVTILGHQDHVERVGVVSFIVRDWPPEVLASALDSNFGIALRSGLHCAPSAHGALGTLPEGALRVSVGPFNDADDIEQVLKAIAAIASPSR